MNQTTAVAYATQPVGGVWTQAETVQIHLKTKPELDTHLYVLLVLQDQSQFVNVSSFYQSLQLRFKTLAQSFDPLKKASFVESLTQLIQDVVSDTPEIGVEILVGYQFGSYLCIGGHGGATAVLVRQGELGRILDTSQGTAVVEGALQSDDIILLTTQSFFIGVPYIELRRTLVERYAKVSIDSILSELVVRFDKKPELSAVGIIFAEFIESNIAAVEYKQKPSLISRVAKKLKPKKKTEAHVYVRQRFEEQRRQRMSMLIVTVLLLLLGTSVSLGWVRRQRLAQSQAFEERSQPIREAVNQALNQKDLNPLRSRSLLQEARIDVEKTLTLYEEDSKYWQELSMLQEEVEALYLEVSGEAPVTPNQFLDLEFIEPGFVAEKLGIADDRLIVLDTAQDRVVSLGLENKDPSPVYNHTLLNGASLVGGSLNQVFVLSNSGVVEIGETSNEVSQVVETDIDWRQVVGFESFAGNVYILDAEQGEIWRYKSVVENKFVRQRWLSPGVAPDFSNVTDMVVDGDIWVVDTDASVRLYSRGVGTAVELIGVEEEIEAKALGVNQNNIYIFDQGKERVYVFDRTGQYQKQYVWQGLGLVTDMVVYEDKIVLLSGSKLYEIKD